VRKKWLILLCLVVIIGAAGLWMWSARQSETLPSLLLPDSNRVHLVAVTVGTNVKINFGTPFERVLARLPGKLGKRFKGNELSSISSHMSLGSDLLLWFRYDSPPQPNTFIQARAVQDGELLHVPIFSAHPQTLSNGQTVAYSGTPLWPRRHRTLTFRIQQALQSSAEAVSLGELTVANPAYANYPLWVPEQLPATRKFGSTTFTLEHSTRGYQTRVRATSDGWPDTSWEVWAHWVRDATGNIAIQADAHRPAPLREGADQGGLITPATSWYGMPQEPAWKIGFQFVRAKSLASNQVFVLRGVPAVSTGSWFSASWQTNLPAGVVQFRHQPDWEDDARRPCLMPFQPHTLDLANPQPRPLAIMILGAVNDTGQKIEPVEGRKIHVPKGSTTLDITIGVPEQHFVEYTVAWRSLVERLAAPQPAPTPAYLEMPDSIRPENVLRELEK
jgi:hypothetical protein